MSFAEDVKFTLNIKDLIGLLTIAFAVISVYFTLQADIEEAKNLPLPTITKEEFQYKDEMVRSAIMATQEDVAEIKETLKVLDKRLYELSQQ
jgi:hypothetical protein